MGISGLLPLLKKATKKSHIRNFKGCTVAVDALCWLHKGAFGCAVKLGKGEPTTAYVTYCLKYINTLLEYNIKPILVFDGNNLPAKEGTDSKRREKRKLSKEKAKELLREGRNSEAWTYFTQCIEITHEMVMNLIMALRAQKIDYIVAPYEADAQLAYLAKEKIVDLIITEDSDLVLYGCTNIFFKMKADGEGALFDSSKIPACFDVPKEKYHFEKFRRMCILSGCDYLESLPGIGLVRAKKVFTVTQNPDIAKVLKQVPRITNVDVEVTEEYINGFIQADNTFLYQLVFDPINKKLIPLNPYSEDMGPDSFPYAGKYVSNKEALDIALCNINPKTLKRVGNFIPSTVYVSDKSIWSDKYTKKKISFSSILESNKKKTETKKHKSTLGKKVELPSIKNILTRKRRRENEDDVLLYEPFEKDLINDDSLKELYSVGSKSPSNSQSSVSLLTNSDNSSNVKNKKVCMEEDSNKEKEIHSKFLDKFRIKKEAKKGIKDEEESLSDKEAKSPIIKRPSTVTTGKLRPTRSLVSVLSSLNHTKNDSSNSSSSSSSLNKQVYTNGFKLPSIRVKSEVRSSYFRKAATTSNFLFK